MKIRITDNKRKAMRVILEAVDRGEFINITTLQKTFPNPIHYGSLRMCVDSLAKDGILTKEPSGFETLLKPTELAYKWFR